MGQGYLLIIVSLILTGCTIKQEYSDHLIQKGETHFKDLRQLTFSGENAEAYFSADGKKLIFQSHDGDSLCDQIYIMDILSGSTELVSTGAGVTTCSFFEYPKDDFMIYASTHLSDPECPSKPDLSHGYVWKLYPGFDIFRAALDGSGLQQLTDTQGYDAEATFSFDGKKIIYTSLASGDLDLWTMNSDGSGKQQLTKRVGYDGGAFYNHNGSKIVWRAYYPETDQEINEYEFLLADNSIRPMALQLWTMNINGTNKKQVTNNHAANFGPSFFPKKDRIIFSSNMHDEKGRDFDLYAIDANGENIERITYFDGFDGFPMFSPDGKYLVFASNRNQKKRGDTNIFVCEWK